MRYGLTRRQSDHLLELRDRLLEIARLFELDTEIKPGVGQFRIALLDLLQGCDSLRGTPRPQLRQTEVQLFTSRLGSELQRPLEFLNGLPRCRRILIERFAQVAMLGQPFFYILSLWRAKQRCCQYYQWRNTNPRSAEN